MTIGVLIKDTWKTVREALANESTLNYDVFLKDDNGECVRAKLGDLTGTSEEDVKEIISNQSGWATYIDTQYPNSGSAFTVSANTDTILPNNAGSKIETQKPTDVVEFYDSTGQVITGRNGDNLDIMIYFKSVPSAANQSMDMWIDIGGAVGELYRQTFSFPKGAGIERGILYSLPSAYTLGTWEANGGTVYVRSTASLDVHSINYNFDRSHKAR